MTKVVLFFQAATLKSKAWRDKIAGIHQYASQANWQVQMVQSGASSSEIKYSLDVWKPIGCIIDRSLSCARNPTALFRDMPVVLMDQDPARSSRTCPNVNHDSAATATLAAKELLGTGVDHFSYVPYHLNTHWNRQRQKALARAVRNAGRDCLDWGRPPFSTAENVPQQDKSIAERLLQLPRPLGLLCTNDQIAQRVVQVANRTGIRIPQDLVVIGVDNDELICEHTAPTISSVLPDFRSGGYAAAALLDRVIRNPKARVASTTYGPLELVRRQSTRRFTFHDTLINRAMALIGNRACNSAFHTEDIVRELGCSRSLLEMRFRRKIGRSVREEIQRLRFEKALSLLKNPYQAITPIPALCGYASEAFFKRLFKARTGMTMREWRKTNMPSRPS